MMLAAASTIAGNLTILAAASNIIIIIEAAECRSIKAYTFFEYFKIGAIVTLANVIVFICFCYYDEKWLEGLLYSMHLMDMLVKLFSTMK
jgi:Na+/H+ antiporter NhaD/arsenite permease-like protein